MTWGFVAVAAVSAVGTAYSANRAGAAANAQARGADAATNETARQYDQTRNDLSSGRSLYEGANSLLGRLYGIPITTSSQAQQQQDVQLGDAWLPAGSTAASPGNRGGSDILFGGNVIGRVNPGGPNGRFVPAAGVDINALRQQSQPSGTTGTGSATTTPDMSGFFTSPDYNFRRDEGNRGIEGSFAARGGAQSGNAMRALTEFNSNLASGEFGNYFNRLSTLAGMGSAATNQTAAYGADAASSASRNALIAGDARASGINNQANIIGQGANDIAGLYGYYNRNRPPSGGGVGYYDINLGGQPRRL